MNENIMNNKLFWVVIVISVINLGGIVMGKILIDKAADKVIERLQKNYSPSPYGPGLDPDKVNPSTVVPQVSFIHGEPTAVANRTSDVRQEMKASDDWRTGWEGDRGFSPAQ